MFQERDGEREILLGNKQLLGIFFVLAILFGVFFTAGYMVGHTTGEKKPVDTAAEVKPAVPDAATANGGETHSVTPESAPSAPEQNTGQEPAAVTERTPAPAATSSAPAEAPKGRKARPVKTELTRSEEEREPAAGSALAPPAGHATYLQVTALAKNDAEAVAKVLIKKGFHAHIAQKPGTQYFRVLVGPVRDAGELNTTRDALKNKGFREVFVQHL
jgi:cell division protein FtsN